MATASSRRIQEPLDTSVRLATPEWITFRFPIAGPFPRAVASLIDLSIGVILNVLVMWLSRLVSLGARAGFGLFLVGLFRLHWGYGAFFEGTFNGQTPGKRLMRSRVVSSQGTPIHGSQAVRRNVTRAFEGWLPFAFLPALSSMFLTRMNSRARTHRSLDG